MQVCVILSTVGRVLRFFGLVFVLPLAVELGYGNWRGAVGFAITGAAEWVIIAFMFLAGANYSLQFWVLRGRPGRLLGNEEFRVYAGVVLLASATSVRALACSARWATSRICPPGPSGF